LFIETPYRNAAVWEALLKTLDASTRLSVSSGLTMATATTRSAKVGELRVQQKHADVVGFLSTPCVFGFGG
jgi:16S rRNA (cytidine1402-2'-O)-methyltransferase